MWYYIKENKEQEGPISDPALVKLFKEGKISPSTQVWSQNMKSWAEFSRTDFYKKTISHKKDFNFENLKHCTYLLRAIMYVFMLLLGYKIHAIVRVIELFSPDIKQINSPEDVKELLQFNETMLSLQLIDLVQWAMFIFIFVTFAIWTSKVIKTAKRNTTGFMMSPTKAVIGTLVPIANIILVPAIVKRIYRSLEMTIRKRRHIVSHIFVKTWMFVWFITWFSIIYNNFAITLKANLHLLDDIFIYKIYNCSLQIFLTFVSIIFVSVILRQLKYIHGKTFKRNR